MKEKCIHEINLSDFFCKKCCRSQKKIYELESDAKAYKENDGDKCQVCHAYGEDKRNLIVKCFYEIKEVVPEALNLREADVDEALRDFYYLRICKSCRGDFLGKMKEWRDARVALQDTPKDHDGCLLEIDEDPERNIPIRANGVTKMITKDEWDALKK